MGLESYLKGNRIKHEAVVDLDKLQEFQAKHDKHIAKKPSDSYAVTYRTSGIGIAVEIACRCGKKADLTDYASW